MNRIRQRYNPGLASRFQFTLTFDSYTPDEIVAIARHIADEDKIAIAEQASPLLHAEASRLRSLPADSGTALDVAGNGRYARKVVIACKPNGPGGCIRLRRPNTWLARRDRKTAACPAELPPPTTAASSPSHSADSTAVAA